MRKVHICPKCGHKGKNAIKKSKLNPEIYKCRNCQEQFTKKQIEVEVCYCKKCHTRYIKRDGCKC